MGNINAVMCRLKPSPVLKPTNGTWIGAHIAMPVGKVIIPSNMFSLLNRVASKQIPILKAPCNTRRAPKKYCIELCTIFLVSSTPPQHGEVFAAKASAERIKI